MTHRIQQMLAVTPRRGILTAAVAAARAFLLDPVESAGEEVPAAIEVRPVVAVFGLARGCGTTVVARALAVELAERDPSGAALVACENGGSGLAPAAPAAKRLAKALVELQCHPRAVGRLCLMTDADPLRLLEDVRGLTPIVIDAGASLLGGVPASVADRTVIVTTPTIEPALARVASDCVARLGREPVLVMNRAERDEPGSGPVGGSGVRLPRSRMGAHLALAGREVRGELGRAVAEVADRCEENL